MECLAVSLFSSFIRLLGKETVEGEKKRENTP
jgi:hypothetical protein